jgi:hypothetical protein
VTIRTTAICSKVRNKNTSRTPTAWTLCSHFPGNSLSSSRLNQPAYIQQLITADSLHRSRYNKSRRDNLRVWTQTVYFEYLTYIPFG